MSEARDPVRDLNNYLQGQRCGNLAGELMWISMRQGPGHCPVYHVTAVFRGVNIGIGHGPSLGSAKQGASVQALEYLQSNAS
ncbi:hypothetical protein BGW80DRAFT_277881 [Lactifluus volemus]|nr:hypothetical protein BGW80DRAFT_277881 [Lactifluus volemus]